MANAGASIGWGLVIAASLLVGALAAVRLTIPGRLAALVTSFGGGILIAAIALDLVPSADESSGPTLTSIGLVAGTLVYVGADAWLTRDEGRRAIRRSGHAAASGRPMMMHRDQAEVTRGESIAAGIFIDGVPESVAVGLAIADGALGIALLVGILLGNVVEAYGAAQPILAGGQPKRFVVMLLGGIGVALALATFAGGTLLAGASLKVIGTAQAFAAGAVLAVVSIAIVPHSFDEVNRSAATATVLGFVVGYLLG